VIIKVGRIMVLTVALVVLGTWAYAVDCKSVGRYEDMGDGTVQDCRTGLIRLKNANCMESLAGVGKSSGGLYCRNAMKRVAALSSGNCGLTDGSELGDWRLPTKTGWMAMVASERKAAYRSLTLTYATGTGQCLAGSLFNNVQSSSYY
jgi:hypothetical protein